MRCKRNIALVTLAVLAWWLPSWAQKTVGDELNLNLRGDVAAGYSGSFGDPSPSSHGLNFGASSTLSGYYYNPKFLSFHLQPYYNRSQSNSTFQSLNDSSGVSGTIDLFSGSHFPGSFSYSKSYEGSGEFGVPGAAGLVTHGNGETFAVSWSALFPRLPTLSVGYSSSAGTSEVYGANASSRSDINNLNLQSTYSIAGFRLMGLYNRQSQEGSFPGLIGDQGATESDNTSDSVTVQASHAIPMHGQWSLGWSHSNYVSGSGGVQQATTNDGESTSVTTGVSVAPSRKLSLSVNTTYDTNLYGLLQQQLIRAGANPSPSLTSSTEGSLTVSGNGFYTLNSHIVLNGRWSHHELYSDTKDRSITQYGGGAILSFDHKWLGGLNWSLGAVDTATEEGNEGASLVTNLNYSRRLRAWQLGGSFHYAQQLETLLAVYTTASYGYNGTARRRFNNGIYWSATVHSSHSAITRVAGSNNHAEGVTSTLTFRRYTASGNYSKSGGISVLTTQGLVPIPSEIPTPLVQQQVLYNAHNLGIGGSVLLRRWVLTLNYSKANSAATGASQRSFSTALVNARLQYRVRKMYLNMGFTRFQQGLTSPGNAPTQVNSYYFGISRWFNVF